MCYQSLKNDTALEDDKSSGIKEVLSKYEDVFPEILPPGLPPERSVEMKIDLESGSNAKLGPIYKLSVLELKEMKKQIQEAISQWLHQTKCQPMGKPSIIQEKEIRWPPQVY